MMARPPGRAERPPSPSDHHLNRADKKAIGRKRRGSLLAEVAMATVILMIAMSLTVKVLGWVALERRAAERRQRAVLEVANVMERITAYPFEEVTPDLTRRITLSTTAGQSLPDSDLVGRGDQQRTRRRPIGQADCDPAPLEGPLGRMGGTGPLDLVDRTTEAGIMILNQTEASPTRRRSSRRGITILEIMVVMTGVAAMLALCALTIQLLMRLNADGHARLSAAVSLERLGSADPPGRPRQRCRPTGPEGRGETRQPATDPRAQSRRALRAATPRGRPG